MFASSRPQRLLVGCFQVDDGACRSYSIATGVWTWQLVSTFTVRFLDCRHRPDDCASSVAGRVPGFRLHSLSLPDGADGTCVVQW